MANDSVEAANAIYLAGYLEAKRGQYAQALPLYRQSIDVFRAALGDDASDIAATRVYLAEALLHLGQTAQAEAELDAAIATLERSASHPYERHHADDFRAQAAWLDGRRSEALADLRRSMDIAEQQRMRTFGAERERAGAFQQFSASYERMVAWQTVLGDATEALVAIERARARSLLDELSLSRMELNL